MLIPSSLFSYNSDSRSMATEISVLTVVGGHFFKDELKIKSEATGVVRTFKLVETKKDRDGDVEYWKFTGDFERGAKDVIVFND